MDRQDESIAKLAEEIAGELRRRDGCEWVAKTDNGLIRITMRPKHDRDVPPLLHLHMMSTRKGPRIVVQPDLCGPGRYWQPPLPKSITSEPSRSAAAIASQIVRYLLPSYIPGLAAAVAERAAITKACEAQNRMAQTAFHQLTALGFDARLTGEATPDGGSVYVICYDSPIRRVDVLPDGSLGMQLRTDHDTATVIWAALARRPAEKTWPN